MNKKILTEKLFFLMAFFLLNSAEAFTQSPQAEKESSIGIALGYSLNGYREETVLDVNRYLHTLVFSITGNMEKKGFLHSYNFCFFRGDIKGTLSYPVDDYELQPDIFGQLFSYYKAEDTFSRIFSEYAVDYRLWGNKNFPGYIGGAFRIDIYLLETLYNPVYINFTALFSLNLHVSQKWIINAKNSVTASLSIPAFAFAIRPHYLGFSAWPVEAGIASFHNYWAGFGSFKYQHNFNQSLSVYSALDLELSRINFPRLRNDAALRLSLGIAYSY